MKQPTLIKITGVIDNLQRWDGEESFIVGGGTKTVGGAVAVGAAVSGLAGAAASAAISTSDTEDPVEFFTCNLGDKSIFGRFGMISFYNGDNVVMVVEEQEGFSEAYAVCRPKDRKIWMYPHCGKGFHAFVFSWLQNISTLTIIGLPLIIIVPDLLTGNVVNIFDSRTLWRMCSMMCICIGIGIIITFIFSKFGRLSSTIFKALGFKNPDSVDLPKRLKIYLKNSSVSDQEREEYHFYSGWVYRY